jgi:hypothetical protein
MYRTVDGALQVLHRVECSDRTVTYRWIAGDVG